MSDAIKKTQKKGIDHDESRIRRVETTIQVRKGKKEELLSKRRTPVDSAADNSPPTYTAGLSKDELEECFRRKMDDLKGEFIKMNLISEADNSMFYLPLVTGFVYGDNQILYDTDQNVQQNSMPGQGTQVTIKDDGTVTILIEKYIPFKVIMIPRDFSNLPVRQREDSFNLKNNLTEEQNGKFCALFLLNMYLIKDYILPEYQKEKIKQILINLDICNPVPGSIDWSKYIFVLMPKIDTNFVEDTSLKMVVKGGSIKSRKTRKSRKTKSKRRKTNKRRR